MRIALLRTLLFALLLQSSLASVEVPAHARDGDTPSVELKTIKTPTLYYSVPVRIRPPDTLGWVSGQVTDADTEEPLALAFVRAEGTAWGAHTRGTGRYLFRVPAGCHLVTASYIDYQADTVLVRIATAETVVVNFKLDGRYWQKLHAEHTRRYDSIKPLLDTPIFDATLIQEHFARDTPTVSEREFADSVRLRALRTWRSHEGRYFARILRIPAEGDTHALCYLLVEDGNATYVRLAYGRLASLRVLRPDGCAVVYRNWRFPADSWRDWNGRPLEHPGRLRLQMQQHRNPDPGGPYRF